MAINANDLGLYKDSRWQFQHESRYKIILYPINEDVIKKHIGNSDNHNFDLTFSLITSIGPSLMMQTPLKESDLFIKLDEKYLENIEVMMGPETTDAEGFIVEKLLAEYPKKSLNDSYFKGKIKSKK